MFRFNRRIPALALTVASVVTALYLLFPAGTTRAQDAAQPKLSELREEQIATLRQAANLADDLFEKGAGTYEAVDRLNRLLIDAELKAAATPQDRITLLKDALAAAKKQEDLMSDKAKGGLVPFATALEAKAYRLSIEVSLAEEQSAK